MASAVNALSGAAAQTETQAAKTPAAPSKEMFLQLLVAQIRNQDPLNPADSVQFVSQLAQFSELEQIISIRELLEGAAASADTGTHS